MKDIYKTGDYLNTTISWHSEDSPWKAQKILEILNRNRLKPLNIADCGCGSGVILNELSKSKELENSYFKGYDISPQAIEIARGLNNSKIDFFNSDLLTLEEQYFDLLLIIDVFEHVPNYLEFLEKCSRKADYKVYHIPLGIHVSSVLRNILTRDRYDIGHIHQFNADIALCALQDTGHEVIDYFYTSGSLSLFFKHASFKRAVANVPRWLLSRLNITLTARLFGGFSLMVLTK
jgi:ubiquinone/menaquinone biosynthesis C-methylase UbiE